MSDHRHWREECGVVGIAGVNGAAELASMAMHALQHRGQESAGICSINEGQAKLHKRLGLVAEVFMHLMWDRPFHRVAFISAAVFVMLFIGIALMDTAQYQPDLIP